MVMSVFAWIKTLRAVHFCLIVTFFTSGLIVNAMQCVLYILLYPILPNLYRKINWYFCATIYSQLVFLGDWWSSSKLIMYIDKDDFSKYWGKEHVLGVSNHTYDIDWLINWMVGDKVGTLGNSKAYVKRGIQYLPILGWCWRFSEFVFLERSFDKDKEIIEKQIELLCEHPYPIGLLLFPEGTRFTPEKHKTSMEFAKQKNLPVLKHHLVPRTKGFVVTLSFMEGKVPAIYDILLAFNHNDPHKPTLNNVLCGKPIVAHFYARRIPMETVPKTDAARENFLRDLFKDKDAMMDSFKATGDFFKTSGVKRVEPFHLERRIYPLLNMIMWLMLVFFPMVYYSMKILLNGQLFWTLGFGGVLLAFVFLFYFSMRLSTVAKGSAYGRKVETKNK